MLSKKMAFSLMSLIALIAFAFAVHILRLQPTLPFEIKIVRAFTAVAYTLATADNDSNSTLMELLTTTVKISSEFNLMIDSAQASAG